MTLGQLGIRRGGALGQPLETGTTSSKWQTLIPVLALAGIARAGTFSIESLGDIELPADVW